MTTIILPIVAGCLLPLLSGPATSGCLPSGDYTGIDGSAGFNSWVDTDFFTITIAFGTFKLCTAKFIDVIWDVVVGRCGQTLLVFVTFQVFTKSVVHTMEKRAVSYPTFAVLSLRDPSLETMLVMAKEWSFYKGLRGKLSVLWIIFASAYVVAFPTLLSAATGYSTRYQPYVSESGGLVPLQNFTQTHNTTFIVEDWRRIGFNSNIVGGIVDENSYLYLPDSGHLEQFSAWSYFEACKYLYLFIPTSCRGSEGSR